MKECPACGLCTDEHAARCDCGHVFYEMGFCEPPPIGVSNVNSAEASQLIHAGDGLIAGTGTYGLTCSVCGAWNRFEERDLEAGRGALSCAGCSCVFALWRIAPRKWAWIGRCALRAKVEAVTEVLQKSATFDSAKEAVMEMASAPEYARWKAFKDGYAQPGGEVRKSAVGEEYVLQTIGCVIVVGAIVGLCWAAISALRWLWEHPLF